MKFAKMFLCFSRFAVKSSHKQIWSVSAVRLGCWRREKAAKLPRGIAADVPRRQLDVASNRWRFVRSKEREHNVLPVRRLASQCQPVRHHPLHDFPPIAQQSRTKAEANESEVERHTTLHRHERHQHRDLPKVNLQRLGECRVGKANGIGDQKQEQRSR